LLYYFLGQILYFIMWGLKKVGYSNNNLDDSFDVVAKKFGIIFLIPSLLIPNSLRLFIYNNQLKFKLIRSFCFGLGIPTIAALIWLASSSSPINDYLLITNCTTAKGYITKSEQKSEVIEFNDGRSSGIRYYYFYEYRFTLPNGKIMKSGGYEDGDLPEYFTNLGTEPYQVVVEYLSDNPKVNRIKGMDSSDNTILEWLEHKIVLGAIIILLCCYWGYTIIKNGLKQYASTKKMTEIVSKPEELF